MGGTGGARGAITRAASTAVPGTTRAAGDKFLVRRASDMAPTIAINNRIEVISNGKRYFVKSETPIEAVKPTSPGPGGSSRDTGTEYRTNATSPLRTAADTIATGTT